MTSHPTLPGVKLKTGFSHTVFERYLKDWREDSVRRSESGDVAASVCLQATVIDIVLDGSAQQDWISVMDDHLTDNGRPVAYSRAYGDRLHKFARQHLQPTLHAIHTRWWIEQVAQPNGADHEEFARLVLAKRQPSGLVYDADVSATILRHRTQAELCASMVMAVEIIGAADLLTDSLREQFAASIADPSLVPPRGSMTTEQLRLAALRRLGHEELFPVGIARHLSGCAEGLDVGWCDFAVAAKTDTHMGSPKRTSRDTPVHSPLVACHVGELIGKIDCAHEQESARKRLTEYARHLSQNPLDIPAFAMRDSALPFGAGITPLETVGASWLISLLGGNPQ